MDLITLDRGGLIKKSKDNPELFAFQNEGNGAEIIIMNTTRPPLDDIRVRQALALANNQNPHIKMVYGDTIPFIRHPFGDGFTCEDDGHLQPGSGKTVIAVTHAWWAFMGRPLGCPLPWAGHRRANGHAALDVSVF
jgi:ABC-type transport system substrate-binding protein